MLYPAKPTTTSASRCLMRPRSSRRHGRRVEQQRRGTRQRPDTYSGGSKARQHLRQTCYELRSAPRHRPLSPWPLAAARKRPAVTASQQRRAGPPQMQGQGRRKTGEGGWVEKNGRGQLAGPHRAPKGRPMIGSVPRSSAVMNHQSASDKPASASSITRPVTKSMPPGHAF